MHLERRVVARSQRALTLSCSCRGPTEFYELGRHHASKMWQLWKASLGDESPELGYSSHDPGNGMLTRAEAVCFGNSLHVEEERETFRTPSQFNNSVTGITVEPLSEMGNTEKEASR